MEAISLLMISVVAISVIANGHEMRTSNESCPPWMYRPRGKDGCECGTSLGGKVQCKNNSHEVHLQHCLCMTYDNSTSMAVVGYCPYACITSWRRETILRQDRETLNQQMCGVWKRRGTLCSQCQPQHGFPFYSYYIGCVKCEGDISYWKEVTKFVAAAYLPLTVMFVLVITFSFNILSPPWSMLVFVAQMLSAPPVLQGVFSYMQVRNFDSVLFRVIAIAYATIFGFWNLDVFRAVYSAACISPHTTILQMAAIEGTIGLYPLFLLTILSIFARLYKKGYRVIIILWTPFHFCLCRLRRKFGIRTSLINTLATLLLLSCVKIGYAALYILTPTRVWSPNGSYKWVCYADPSVTYFSKVHAIYASITAVITFGP